ncbi:MAG: ferritin [Candidatus Woesearchaeota archaeon]
MKLSDHVQNELNEQVNRELFSGYLYLSLATWFDNQGLNGFSHWMKRQALEEKDHGMKIYEYIYDREGCVSLRQIDEPPRSWEQIKDAINAAYLHEQYITREIYRIMDQARNEKDFGTVTFLQWFVTEQVEEEKSVKEILDRLELIGDNKQGLVMIDKELAQRE